MEKQTGFLGVSGRAWIIIGVLGLAGSAMTLCALVLLLFGTDVGGMLS